MKLLVMWEKCKKYITGGVVGCIVAFLVAFSLVKNFMHLPKPIVSTPEKTVVVKLVSHVDTVYKKQIVHDTIHITAPSIVRSDTIYKPGTRELAFIPNIRNTYSDSTKILKDSVQLSYRASVSGRLNDIKLGFKDFRAQKIIVKQDSVFTTTTIKQYPAGLFVGVDAGYNQITPKLEYIKNKNSFSAGYNVITKTPQIGFSRKIF